MGTAERERLISLVLDLDTGLADQPYPREQTGLIVDVIAAELGVTRG